MTVENLSPRRNAGADSYKRTPLLEGDDPKAKRQEILEYFDQSFERYESLFSTLRSDKAFYQKPISLRHPLIFYYGHTATFFVNKMLLAGMIDERINPNFEAIFAIGVDEMSWDDVDEEHYDWPSVEDVRAYRKQVKSMVNDYITKAPLKLPIDWTHSWWVILMGIEHEQIHLETSTVLIRQQKLELVQSSPQWRPFEVTQRPAPQNALVKIPSGTVRLGKPHNDTIYGWDNEYGTHSAEVGDFEASRYLVSNQEFYEFVSSGGYEQDMWWEEEGLSWRQYTQATHPTFWIKSSEGWQMRLMTEVVDMPWSWPVDVNYHEAKAFCNWKAKQSGKNVRLPTEDEWYRIYDHAGLEELDSKCASANIHLDYAASSCPVDQFAHGELYDVIGNLWQWTETPTYPFDDFKVHPVYDDFTTPTFDGRHNLIKGGSWVSCGNESRRASRYAFRRHFFQHAGFRYVVSDNNAREGSTIYETDHLLAQYAEFHYGDDYFEVPNFPKVLAELAVALMGSQPKRSALDIGCAVGRSTFELAKHFDNVVGIDFSARFINLGVQLAQKGEIGYAIVEEGDLLERKLRRLDEMGLQDIAGKVNFMQGDACNLKPNYRGYDLILAANLIDRLYTPVQFLRSVHERLNEGGILFITSPYTWLEEYTEKTEWLGGFEKDGERVTTLDGLKSVLGPQFDLIHGPVSVPFVIRETRRKYQHTLSEVTVWKRKT